MKIAVTYDNGNVFQHFGHSEAFKVYEVENGLIQETEVVEVVGAGHEALAGDLAAQGVNVVICGGLGDGAATALEAAGIDVVSGVQGNVDVAVDAYLAGTLESEGVNCDHHHEEEAEGCGCGCGGGCGSDDEEGCGSGCGGGCGGCGGGAPRIIFEGPNAGKQVKTHYHGTLDDGTVFDSSYDRGEPLAFTAGVGMMIPGYDKAVVNMNVGDIVEIHLEPEEAYGPRNEEAVFEVEKAKMPGTENLKVGERVYLQNQFGQPFPALVTASDDTMITFDMNHEMAGKALNFKIELVEIEE